jgi:hypothetical protein
VQLAVSLGREPVGVKNTPLDSVHFTKINFVLLGSHCRLANCEHMCALARGSKWREVVRTGGCCEHGTGKQVEREVGMAERLL